MLRAVTNMWYLKRSGMGVMYLLIGLEARGWARTAHRPQRKLQHQTLGVSQVLPIDKVVLWHETVVMLGSRTLTKPPRLMIRTGQGVQRTILAIMRRRDEHLIRSV